MEDQKERQKMRSIVPEVSRETKLCTEECAHLAEQIGRKTLSWQKTASICA